MKYPRKWESLIGGVRLKVHGGWIFHSNDSDIDVGVCESMCFVPDPKHEWILEDETKKDNF